MRSLLCARRFGLMLMILTAIGMLGSSRPLRSQSEAKRREISDAAPSAAVAAGQKIFASTCAGCHGLDARGGERAPDILARPEVQRMSAVEISRVVREGSQSRAMPAFGKSLDEAQIGNVTIYLRSLLTGHSATAALPGDPALGKLLFFGKAACADCHMIEGSGGFMGADLTNYAESRSPDELHGAITDPANNSQHHEKMVSVATRGGEHFTGMARNEDNFSLQLQTADGMFHLLMKSELEQIEYQKQPLMHVDYSQKLNPGELNDLVSYLMRTAAANAKTEPLGPRRKDSDED